MVTFSLNSFIKICSLDTGGRISEIQKKLEDKGGYDFYHSFQRATRAKLKGEADDAVDDILEAPAKPAERKLNKEAYERVQSKFGKTRSIEPLEKKKTLKFPSANISLAIDPLFSLEKAGVVRTYSVWATQRPDLTQKYGAVACYIMREAYKNTSLSNSQFFYYDTLNDRTYSEKQINNNTSLILNADLASISDMLKNL